MLLSRGHHPFQQSAGPDQAAKGKVSDFTVENITGNFGSFGTFAGTLTDVRDITLRNINVKVLGQPDLDTDSVINLKIENVNVTTNGTP